MPITRETLVHAIEQIHARIAPIGEEMNALDGRLGDGDLGVTLVNGFKNLNDIKEDLPDDVGKALIAMAKAVTAVSGSSFGTLFATALMAAAKSAKGREAVEWAKTAELLQAAQDAMISRGGANIGDKTMLDVTDAIIAALQTQTDPGEMLLSAREAASDTLNAFRERPNKIGRARVYAEKSIGMDDPGMVAVIQLLGCFSKT